MNVCYFIDADRSISKNYKKSIIINGIKGKQLFSFASFGFFLKDHDK